MDHASYAAVPEDYTFGLDPETDALVGAPTDVASPTDEAINRMMGQMTAMQRLLQEMMHKIDANDAKLDHLTAQVIAATTAATDAKAYMQTASIRFKHAPTKRKPSCDRCTTRHESCDHDTPCLRCTKAGVACDYNKSATSSPGSASAAAVSEPLDSSDRERDIKRARA